MIDYLIPLRSLFVANQNEENAASMSAYMKGHFAYFGIKSTERREIQNQFISEHGLPEPFEPVVFEAFWSAPEREFQMAGLDILRRQAKKSEMGDIELIEKLITTKSWWDTVDGLSSWVAGPYFLKFPEQTKPITDRWAVSENMWLRRASIIFQLGYKGKTDVRILKDHIELNLGSTEFFINKAIGWALREYGKTDPDSVIIYVDELDGRIRPLSKREALKNLR